MAFGVSFSGLDYVSHEDILPYSSTDQVPIQHELFERFLMYDQTKGNTWLWREIFKARYLRYSVTSIQNPSLCIQCKKSWPGLGFVTVKPPLNNFCNYVKGVALRGKHSGYVMPVVINSHLSLPTVPPFVARDTLCAWQEKNHPWLELSDVHRETTENIRVTVIPFYMGMRVGLCYMSLR